METLEKLRMNLHDFKVLTFDCYGTLIDWEAGILAALQPMLTRVGVTAEAALITFAEQESAQEHETPDMIYSELLTATHARMARFWGQPADMDADHRFGASVKNWPAFADSPAALAYLKQHYQLMVLSNVDNVSFRGSAQRLGVAFDAVYTAQDIGSYKPDPRNFAYLQARLAEQGIAQGDVLHTAQSLYHDHVPAYAAGFTTCWIDRRAGRTGGATKPPGGAVDYKFRFTSLAEMVAAHQAEAIERAR